MNGEDGDIVHCIGVISQVRHIFHPDATDHAVFHQEADAVGVGVLWLIGVNIVVFRQDVAALFLHAVDQVTAVCADDLRLAAAYVNAAGSGNFLGQRGFQKGNDVPGRLALLFNVRISKADAFGLQAVHCIDSAAVISGHCGFLAVQPQGSTEGIFALLLTQLQELAGFCPIQNQGEVGGRVWGGERVLCVRSGVSGRRFGHFADLAVICMDTPMDDNAQQGKDDHGQSTQRRPPSTAVRECCRCSRDRYVPGLRRLRQFRNRHAEFPCQGDQIRHVRRCGVGLPLTDRLAADAQPLTQGLLGNAQLFSIGTDALSQRHGATSFVSVHRIPQMWGNGYQPHVKYRLRRWKREEDAGNLPAFLFPGGVVLMLSLLHHLHEPLHHGRVLVGEEGAALLVQDGDGRHVLSR